MRSRMIHSDFWKSESVAELDPMGRLLFMAMWGMADREGLLLYKPRRMAIEAFPYDGVKPDKIKQYIEEMKHLGMVRELASPEEEKTCLQITNFSDYQPIHAKEAKSKLKDRYIPGNSSELRVIPGNSAEFPPASTSTSTSTSVNTVAQGALQVLAHLNKTTGRNFQNTTEIEKCIKRDKATVEECCLVIDHKWAEWGGTELAKNVNAVTPWRPSHFKAYLDEARAGPPATRQQESRKIIENPDEEFFRQGMEDGI